MRYEVRLDEVKRYVEFVGAFASPGSINQAYRYLKIGAKVDGLSFETMSGVVFAHADMAAMGEGDETTVLVDPALLKANLQSMAGGTLTFEVTGKAIHLKQADKDHKVQAAPADIFPEAPKVNPTTDMVVSAKGLLEKGNLISFAAAKTRERPVLQCLYVDKETGLMIAADGGRLAYVELGQGIDSNLLVLPNILEAVAKIVELRAGLLTQVDDIELTWGEGGWVRVSSDVATAYVATMGAEYPSTAIRVLQDLRHAEDGVEVKIDKSTIIPALRLACTFADMAKLTSEPEAVAIEVDQDQIALKMAIGVGHLEDEFSATTTGEAYIQVHPSHLMDILNAVPDTTVAFRIWAEGKPMLFYSVEEGTPWWVVQMPMIGRGPTPEVKNE